MAQIRIQTRCNRLMNPFLVTVELDLFEGPDDDPHVVDVSELEAAADITLLDVKDNPVEGSLVESVGFLNSDLNPISADLFRNQL